MKQGEIRKTTLTCNPALAERETAFAFALPESLPALPPACKTALERKNKYKIMKREITVNFLRRNRPHKKLHRYAVMRRKKRDVYLQCTNIDNYYIRVEENIHGYSPLCQQFVFQSKSREKMYVDKRMNEHQRHRTSRVFFFFSFLAFFFLFVDVCVVAAL